VKAVRDRSAERRALARAANWEGAGAQAEPPQMVRRAAEARPVDTPEAEPERQGGLLGLMPALMRRPDPEPELIETEMTGYIEAPGEDRVRAKIADVIKSRVPKNPNVQVDAEAPPTKGRGRGPDPLIFDTGPMAGLPPEPPLTAAHRPPEAGPVPQEQEIETFVHASPRIPVAEPKKVVQHPPRKTPQPSQQAMAEAQPALQFDEAAQVEYELPPLSLLTNPTKIERHQLSDESLEENAREKLERKRCDLIVANDVSRRDIGFDAEANELLLVYPGQRPPRPGGHDVRAGAGAWPEGFARDRPGGRYRPQHVGAVRAGQHSARPHCYRHRVAEREPGNGRSPGNPFDPEFR